MALFGKSKEEKQKEKEEKLLEERKKIIDEGYESVVNYYQFHDLEEDTLHSIYGMVERIITVEQLSQANALSNLAGANMANNTIELKEWTKLIYTQNYIMIKQMDRLIKAIENKSEDKYKNNDLSKETNIAIEETSKLEY